MVFTLFTGVRSNQDLIWCVKIGVYVGFNVYGGSWLLWLPVNRVFSDLPNCVRFTKLCWVGKDVVINITPEYYETDELPQIQGQPQPKKNQV